MTVLSTQAQASYAGNASATTFAFPFKIQSESDLLVQQLDNLGNITTLLLNTDYSMPTSAVDVATGGSITFPIGGSLWPVLPVGWTIFLTRATALTQPVDLANQGPYYPENVEDALDRSVMLLQQLQLALLHTLTIPITDPSADALPSAAQRANQYLTFDSNGNPIVSTGTGADAGLRGDLASASATLGSSLVTYIQVTPTGTLTSGNAVISSISSFTNVFLGATVTGNGIQSGSVITNINQGSNQITLSKTASGNGSQTLTITSNVQEVLATLLGGSSGGVTLAQLAATGVSGGSTLVGYTATYASVYAALNQLFAQQVIFYAADSSGTANAMTISVPAVAAYADGQTFAVKVMTLTTNFAPTLKVNALATLNIYAGDGGTVPIKFKANETYLFTYNSSLNSGAGGFNTIGLVATQQGAVTITTLTATGLTITNQPTQQGVNVPVVFVQSATPTAKQTGDLWFY